MIHNKARGTCGALLGVALLAACGGGSAPTDTSSAATVEASAASPPGVQASADGTASGVQREHPMAVPGGSARPAVAGGEWHSLALKSDGTVWAWGRNTWGQLGNLRVPDSSTPVQVVGPAGVGTLTGVTAIAAGAYHSLALKSDGTVWAWGSNLFGQLARDNGVVGTFAPQQVRGAGGAGVLTDVSAIAAGWAYSLALKSDGTVWAWGANPDGQLGNNSTAESRVPVQVLGAGGVGALTGATAITAKNSHSLALTSVGTVWAWGLNGDGQLGNGSTTSSSVPVQVVGPGGVGLITGVTAIAAGYFHSLAHLANGGTLAWGNNNWGQLGNTPNQTLVPVAWIDNFDQTAIAAGGRHSLTLADVGWVVARGNNEHGQLGATGASTLLGYIVGGPSGTGTLRFVTAIAAGGNHSLALTSDGTVWAWGDNGYGQLGNNSTTGSSIPVQVRLTAPHSFYGDFNGDGRSDILWRNTATGQVVIWLMNGTGISGSGAPATVTTDWVIEGVGDFNGDGRADIAWRNASTGQVVIWLMNGTGIIGSGAPASVPADWVIQGFGDFNADGKADIVWRNVSTGQVVIWLMNGAGIGASGAPATVSADWAIQGFGDFNGDGKADVAWRNPNTGQVVIWTMNGTSISGSGATATVSTDWAIQGFGDFNADGKADIGWRNVSTGQVAIWLMNGTDIIGSGAPATVSAEWAVQGFGDFNGDGKADIAWRDATTGQVVIWLMNGTGISSSGAPATVSTDWQIMPP